MSDLFRQKLGLVQQARLGNIKGYSKLQDETAKSLCVCKAVSQIHVVCEVPLEMIGNKHPR